jgi:Zn ribbon nucleic-acid-binding protein
MLKEYKWWENANPCPRCGSTDLYQLERDTICWTLLIECSQCGYFGKEAKGKIYEGTSKKAVALWNISDLEKELL